MIELSIFCHKRMQKFTSETNTSTSMTVSKDTKNHYTPSQRYASH